jgi:hypothetical protein
MPLGYKYVQREATDYVNWAEIGKNMSDMLQNENKIREEKKAAIDEDSRQIGINLSKYPQGQDDNAKKAALKLADNATQYKNLQLKLLKSGKLKLRDYLINTQNLKDSIAESFDALTAYQKNYGEIMDGYKNGTISKMTVDDWAKTEGFGNWNQSDFYINQNGIVNIAMKEKKVIDGKEIYTMSDNPNNFASPSYIKGLLLTRKDKLDVQKISDDWASKMAPYIKTDEARSYVAGLYKQGKIVTVDDVKSRKDYETLSNGAKLEVFNFYNAEKQWINGELSNPYSRGSVLIDHLQFEPTTQKMYRRTQDKADAAANPEAIYEEINPSTQQSTLIFSDKQKKDSEDYVRNMTRPKYKYAEKVETTGQIQDQYNKDREAAKKGEEEKANAMSAWNDIFKAKTIEGKRAAIDHVLGTKMLLDAGIKNIDPQINPNNPDEIKLTATYTPDENGNTREPRILYFNTKTQTLGDWAKIGSEFHGISDVSKVMERAGGGNPNAKMSNEQRDFKGIKTGRVEQNYSKKVYDDVSSMKDDKSIIVKDNNKKTASNLNAKYGNLGFTFTGDWGVFGGDYINVETTAKGKDGAPLAKTQIKIDASDSMDDIRDKLASFMSTNLNKKLAKSVYGDVIPEDENTPAPTPAPAATPPAENTLNASKRKKP